MASITGLQSGEFTDIDVIYSISIDGDAGQNGQVLSSDGTNTLWIDGSAIDREDLTAADSTITISGGAYDGTVARTIQTNKVPNSLTAGTNISFNTGSTYDGSAAITISATDTNTQLSLVEGSGIVITNIGGLNRRIACDVDADTIDFDGTELAVQKVPNVLTAGSNVSFVVTADGAAATTYDGSEGITITGTANTDTQLNLTGGTGITITNTGGLNRTIAITPNIPIGLPHNVFLVGGVLRMTINLANFYPNDDSSYFNIAVEDDGSAKIHGALKPQTSSLEVVGYFVIPNGYEATGGRVDVTNSSGASVTRSVTYESFTTYTGTSFSNLLSGYSNSELSFSSNLTGASDKLLLIRIITTSTTDHIRGGYIVLSAV